jgi:hypothetical protein
LALPNPALQRPPRSRCSHAAAERQSSPHRWRDRTQMLVIHVAVIALALALLAPLLPAEAQQPGKKVRIGVLAQGFPDPPPGLPLGQPLRALGWREDQNVVFESRFGEGKQDRLPTLAADVPAAMSTSSSPGVRQPPWRLRP